VGYLGCVVCGEKGNLIDKMRNRGREKVGVHISLRRDECQWVADVKSPNGHLARGKMFSGCGVEKLSGEIATGPDGYTLMEGELYEDDTDSSTNRDTSCIRKKGGKRA